MAPSRLLRAAMGFTALAVLAATLATPTTASARGDGIRPGGPDVGALARVNGVSQEVMGDLLEDPTVFLTDDGDVQFAEPAPASGLHEPTSAAMPAPAALADTFRLHSKPGSPRTLYIDVDGHEMSGTGWNTYPGVSDPYVTSAWNTEGAPETFTDLELARVQEVWARVAEDFAPFDVDVTTEEPAEADLVKEGEGDARYGARLVVTSSSEARSRFCPASSPACAGIAGLNVLGSGDQPVAWVFGSAFAPTAQKYVAEAVSHELGHVFGLSHDGSGDTAYYPGHGLWSPLMGNGDRAVTQWSRGSYVGATNTEDDLAIIASGAPYRLDEAGSTVGTSSVLPSGVAYVGSRSDVDVYRLGTCTGPVSLSATPAPVGPNLDIRLRLLDAAGAVVATANPPVSTVPNSRVADGLDAAIDTTVQTGTYYLSVEGVGAGDPSTSYDDYGSIGAYTTSFSGCTGATVAAPGPPGGVTASPTDDGRGLRIAWSAPSGASVDAYRVSSPGRFTSQVAGSARAFVLSGLAPGTTHEVTVTALRAGVEGAGTSVTESTHARPGAPGLRARRRSSDGAAVFTWSPPSTTGGRPLTGYQYRLNGEWQDTQETSRTYTNVNGATLRFAVRSVTSVGVGPETVVYSQEGVPSAATAITTSPTTTAGRVDVSWRPPFDEGGYPVQYEVHLDGTFDHVAFGPSTTLHGLTPGATHTVRVVPYNQVGRGEPRDLTFVVPARLSPPPPTAPGVPRAVSAASGAAGGTVTARATWRPPASNGGRKLTGYQVIAYRLDARGKVVRTVRGSTLRPSARKATVRLAAGRYRFAVRARNVVGWGRPSARTAAVTAR